MIAGTIAKRRHWTARRNGGGQTGSPRGTSTTEEEYAG